MAPCARPPTIFLLSPARCAGKRADLLRSPYTQSALARDLQAGAGVPLGELFAFLSSLYFRGKLGYAERFARPPPGLPGLLVITQGLGLRPVHELVTLRALSVLAEVDVDADNPQFAAPLARDAAALVARAPGDCTFVLLGSVATRKYVDPLLSALGERLLFPSEFVGRGDMSRGGLLLRAARQGRELAYTPVASSPRRGARPPRLPRVRASRS
jgi:hypothetical protein